ncbi:MAG: HNH endonuclease [Verrucomicrobia bacterium]|nr:HNH endonuclease [Verrucomicrobiota bacterium]
MSTSPFNWKQFHSYRVFDEFLESFLIKRKSYVIQHDEALNLEEAFDDIEKRFVTDFDDSEATFEDKVAQQFNGASEQTKIVFANVEFLWAMPMENITPEKKRSYALRWFDEAEVVSGERYFFGYPHIIANPGSWYLRNKYFEIVAALRVLSLVTKKLGFTDLENLKTEIAKICYSSIYEGVPKGERFAVEKVCGIHSALMHLADPERHESIISASHREQICAVFGHVVEKPSADVEVLLKQIRAELYLSHGNNEDPDLKYRWFFYSKDVRPLWNDKTSKREQRVSSAIFDVRLEEDAEELEGAREEVTGLRILRSAKLANEAKLRDGYKCRACGFHFEDQIVHIHHLDPVSEYKRPKATKLEDLITLCPNCHYIAHYWLRISPEFKRLETLLAKLSAK